MNNESVNLRRVKVPVEAGTQIVAGDFAWDFDSEKLVSDKTKETAHIYISLPGEGGGWSAIKVRRGAAGGERVWGWDGNEDKPTLTPSIHMPGVWHGHCIAGKLVSV